MPITGADIFKRVSIILQNAGNVRWPTHELVLWLNDALLQIAMSKPSAVSRQVVMDLQTGTYQRLPDGYFQLMRAVANVTSPLNQDPPTMSRSITPVERAVLDQQYPDWHDTGVKAFTDLVRHISYDPADPDAFYVFPGNTGSGRIAIVAAVHPDPVVAPNNTDVDDEASYTNPLPVKDIYRNALIDYVLYKCYIKDQETPNAAATAAGHLQLFQAALGIKSQAEMSTTPDTVNAPGA